MLVSTNTSKILASMSNMRSWLHLGQRLASIVSNMWEQSNASNIKLALGINTDKRKRYCL